MLRQVNATDSELLAVATYRIGRTLGEAAVVPAGLAQGIRGQRNGYDFRVSAPSDVDGGSTEARGDDEPSTSTMWCYELSVQCRKFAPLDQLDPNDALRLTGLIARDVLTALVLNIPKLGFPGETPPRETFSVTIDGEQAKVDAATLRDPNSVTVVSTTVVSLDQLTEAATGQHPPSRARMMAAEAGHQVLFNPRASEVTAVVVAASACEVAIHECVRKLASGHTERLVKSLVPQGSQAKLSPKDLLDVLIPLITGRRLADERPNHWGSIKKLFSARDDGVHQGLLPPDTDAKHLVNAARSLVWWIEGLEPSRQD